MSGGHTAGERQNWSVTTTALRCAAMRRPVREAGEMGWCGSVVERKLSTLNLNMHSIKKRKWGPRAPGRDSQSH